MRVKTAGIIEVRNVRYGKHVPKSRRSITREGLGVSAASHQRRGEVGHSRSAALSLGETQPAVRIVRHHGGVILTVGRVSMLQRRETVKN